jgi:hypothetical protein
MPRSVPLVVHHLLHLTLCSKRLILLHLVRAGPVSFFGLRLLSITIELSSTVHKTLLDFFPKADKELPRRRNLDAPASTVLTKPLSIGRVNFLPIHIGTEAAGSERLRRYRPRGTAAVPRMPRRPLAPAVDGFREVRVEPLTADDIWLSGPPPYKPSEEDIYNCTVCLQLMSHPVLYVYFHSMRIYPVISSPATDAVMVIVTLAFGCGLRNSGSVLIAVLLSHNHRSEFTQSKHISPRSMETGTLRMLIILGPASRSLLLPVTRCSFYYLSYFGLPRLCR